MVCPLTYFIHKLSIVNNKNKAGNYLCSYGTDIIKVFCEESKDPRDKL